jgi:hypothetical protein
VSLNGYSQVTSQRQTQNQHSISNPFFRVLLAKGSIAVAEWMLDATVSSALEPGEPMFARICIGHLQSAIAKKNKLSPAKETKWQSCLGCIK